MPKYKVLLQFYVTGDLYVEADSPEEAEEIALHKQTALPEEPWNYTDGSIQLIDGCTEEVEEE